MIIPSDKMDRLNFWQHWLSVNDSAYSVETALMDHREDLYAGRYRRVNGLTRLDEDFEAPHVHNIIAENIESMVNSTIPQPKVRAMREEDEWRAQLIEAMLRGELDRLRMEELNDLMERTVPIQGGAFWAVQWDSRIRSGDRVGDVSVTAIHPKQIVPQDGVYSSVEDMDAIVLKTPQTKSYVARVYGIDVVDLDQLHESEPDIKSTIADSSEDMVTMYTAYYRNEDGGVGRYVWVNDTVLEDIDDYQLRRPMQCDECGAHLADGEDECPNCGSRKHSRNKQGYEEIWNADGIDTQHGSHIPGMVMDPDGMIRPTRIPFYRPDEYPVFIQRNISVFGKLLGDSDVDKIVDQQNTMNRLDAKIIDRMIKAGSRITLPDRADIKVDPKDSSVWYIGSAADKSAIGLYDFKGDLSTELNYRQMVYDQSRQVLGITDSYQGRTDATATSGRAKEFAAAQSAGRLESKRVLKEAAYAELFKRIFQLKLAYADEPRPVLQTDERGDASYSEFNRYDFLRQDTEGNWQWIDDFAFSCDTSAPLANNREAMWERITASFQSGAFGNHSDPQTLIFYWDMMEKAHFPIAGTVKTQMEAQLRQMQQQAAEQQMMMQQSSQADQVARQMAERDVRQQIDRQAMQDALNTMTPR